MKNLQWENILYFIYWLIATIISINYAIRGKNWYENNIGQLKIKSDILHQYFFHFSSTLSGFVSLAVAYKIFNSFEVNSLNNISVGTSVLLIFLFIWGVVGLSGWLTNVIVNINEILKGLIKK